MFKGLCLVIIVMSRFVSATLRYSVDVNLSCDNKPTLSRFMKLKFKDSFTWELENEVHMTHEEVQTIPYFLLDVS